MNNLAIPELKDIFLPASIRQSAQTIFRRTLEEKTHFLLDLSRLDQVVDYVLACTQENYPQGEIPYHGRVRHLEIFWDAKSKLLENVHALLDLVFVSVLLDGGAGPAWSSRWRRQLFRT